MIEYLKLLENCGERNVFVELDQGTPVCHTYAEYLKDMRACARKLEEKLGNIRDKHIGIVSDNDYVYLVTIFAIIFSRGVAVPLNNRETPEVLAEAVKKADIDALVVSGDVDTTSLQDVILIPDEDLSGDGEEESSLFDFDGSEADRTALLLFTSGTTSVSKCVELSVKSIFFGKRPGFPRKLTDKLGLLSAPVVYGAFSFYHMGGIIGWLDCSETGCTLCKSRDIRYVLSDLSAFNADIAVVTPAILKLFLKSLERGRADRLGSVKYIMAAGAVLEPETTAAFISNGIGIGQFYGQTETGGTITTNYDVESNPKSVGKPDRDVRVGIEQGEICVNFWGNMKGYYKDPEETRKTLENGTVFTGDLGYIDENGYVYITGRKKNLIILSGGENVSPEEIEAKIYADPLIRECRVYERNDRIVADIYAPGLSEEQIREYIAALNKELPIYKRISHAEKTESELPKTATGKIRR
jgi:long-chain acyl-CoA synthetase